jgi:hypothetical protein
MTEQLDLFAWAESRPTALIIDGRPRFDRKIVAFFGALVRGYEPPYRETEIIHLVDWRNQRDAA